MTKLVEGYAARSMQVERGFRINAKQEAAGQVWEGYVCRLSSLPAMFDILGWTLECGIPALPYRILGVYSTFEHKQELWRCSSWTSVIFLAARVIQETEQFQIESLKVLVITC